MSSVVHNSNALFCNVFSSFFTRDTRNYEESFAIIFYMSTVDAVAVLNFLCESKMYLGIFKINAVYYT